MGKKILMKHCLQLMARCKVNIVERKKFNASFYGCGDVTVDGGICKKSVNILYRFVVGNDNRML